MRAVPLRLRTPSSALPAPRSQLRAPNSALPAPPGDAMQPCLAGDVEPVMKRAAIVLTFLIAGAAQAGWFDDCDHHARRAAQVDMNGVTRVIVIAKAGSLRVDGHDGARIISASGEACASEEDLLRDITLTATRSGSTATVEVHVPVMNGSFFFCGGSAALDLTVSLPPNLPGDIT